MAAKTVIRSDFTRLWFLENRAGPDAAPRYVRAGKAGTLSWNQGNSTPVFEPSGSIPGKFEQISAQPGTPDAPQLPVTVREEVDGLNLLLRLINQGNCEHDWQVAIGTCKNPQDFNRGWQKKLVLEAATISNYGSSGDLGALQPGDRNIVEETATLNGVSLYETIQLTFTEILGADITKPMIDVVVCGFAGCGGDCGEADSGCDTVFFISSATAGSPGAQPVVLASGDGGNTATANTINTLAANEDPDAGACVGDNLVIVSNDSASLHYASMSDLQAGVATPFTEVTTGFIGAPNDIYSPSPNDVFIAANGGYLYYTSNPADGVTAQLDGSLTAQNLTRIHGIDNNHVIAGGAANTLVVTHDGGTTWGTRTLPSAQAAQAITALCMISKDIYWVGYGNGKMYKTTNDGGTWEEKGFSGSGTGIVQDIVFPTRTVGYMSHSTATPHGRIFRTTDGGSTWYLLPDDVTAAAIPANDRVYALAACNPNTVFGAGLADNAVDGFAIKLT